MCHPEVPLGTIPPPVRTEDVDLKLQTMERMPALLAMPGPRIGLAEGGAGATRDRAADTGTRARLLGRSGRGRRDGQRRGAPRGVLEGADHAQVPHLLGPRPRFSARVLGRRGVARTRT